MSTTATTDQTQTTCPLWCKVHVDDGEGGIVHKARVTVGEAVVTLELAPGHDGPIPSYPILLPEWDSADASAAHDLSEALIIAASVIDGNHNGALLVDHG